MMTDRIYTHEVLRHIRDKKYQELNSTNIGAFVRR